MMAAVGVRHRLKMHQAHPQAEILPRRPSKALKGLLKGATAAPTSAINVPDPVAAPASTTPAMPEAPVADEMDESDIQAMRARLQAL